MCRTLQRDGIYRSSAELKNIKLLIDNGITLKGETVRITVETDTLNKGTVTYSDFTSLEDVLNGEIIKGQVMFFDGINNMGRINQRLVKILKIEIYDHEWVEKFTV